jgi:hypothetical protein
VLFHVQRQAVVARVTTRGAILTQPIQIALRALVIIGDLVSVLDERRLKKKKKLNQK